MGELQCVVVTPEQTELDVEAESITVPLFDGEMGILKGHSPLVGRLGYGVLQVRKSAGSEAENYFVDGGFVQVAANVVSVLTDKITPLSEINRTSADEAMKAALEMPSDQPDLAAVRQKAVTRARALSRVVAG